MNVTIRPLTYEDALSFEYWGVHEEAYLSDYNFLARGENEIMEWYRWKIESPKAYYFAILEDGSPCGYVAIKNINEVMASCELGIVLDPNKVNRKIGHQALELTMDEAHKNLGLVEFNLRVACFNKRAISCYRSLGFETVYKGLAPYKADPIDFTKEENLRLKKYFFKFLFLDFFYYYKMRLRR